MAKTSTERMRELRARKKQRQKKAEQTLAPTVYAKPLSDFFRETNRSGFPDHYLMLGDNWWDFSNDDPLTPRTEDALTEEEGKHASNSLGKAELLMDVLGEIVETLARDINEYKRAEIKDRVQEIEESNLSDPVARRNAVAQLVRLQKMLDELDGQVRWTFPRWNVTGD